MAAWKVLDGSSIVAELLRHDKPANPFNLVKPVKLVKLVNLYNPFNPANTEVIPTQNLRKSSLT